MTTPPPLTVAGDREEGALCRHCQGEIRAGDPSTSCPACGGLHHWDCWSNGNGCAAYECSPANRTLSPDDNSVLRVTLDELAKVAPPPIARAHVAGSNAVSLSNPTYRGPKKWNRLAISSLIISIVGIPLFGLFTGLIGIIFGCIALAGHSSRWKGAAMAVAGIVLGIIDVAGWTVGLLQIVNVAGVHTTVVDQFEPDPKSLNELPAPINRAMKSNVLIQTVADLAHLRGSGIGSGIIVRIKDQVAWILTNRHVIDPSYADDVGPQDNQLPQGTRLTVKSIGQPVTSGQLVWIAPHGVDLALITMPVTSTELNAAIWNTDAKIVVGNDVFAIGNPHGLGWTYTAGGISQMRLQTKGPLEIRVIQTSAAINPGNSGGGLYDREGRLVGINTWTKDKRFAEGISFSIAFHSLLPLLPAEYKLPAQQLENDAP